MAYIDIFLEANNIDVSVSRLDTGSIVLHVGSDHVVSLKLFFPGPITFVEFAQKIMEVSDDYTRDAGEAKARDRRQ